MGSGWQDHGVSFNSGKCCLGTEPNHPDTNACIKVGANIGSIIEKRIGICYYLEKSQEAYRVMDTITWRKLGQAVRKHWVIGRIHAKQ